jgi:AAA domain/Bifunctional DNA primase/polymerase, N-terminal
MSREYLQQIYIPCNPSSAAKLFEDWLKTEVPNRTEPEPRKVVNKSAFTTDTSKLPQPPTPLEIASGYIARGWNPVPVKFRDKKPSAGTGWEKVRMDLDNVAEYFKGLMNVGVQMGAASNNLCDVDLDCAEALTIAPYILPKTLAVFGRSSKRRSHMLYRSDLADAHDRAAFQFKDPAGSKDEGDEDAKVMLVELRIGGGGKGAQTVFPGSTHASGEVIDWEDQLDGVPDFVDGDRLLKCVKILSAACLFARHWRRIGGRHDAALIMGGFLARCKMSRAQAKPFAEAVARAAGADAAHTIRNVVDAFNNYATGKNTFGYPSLVEMFGEKVAKKIAEWLDFETSDDTKSDAKASEPRQLKTITQFCAEYEPLNYILEPVIDAGAFYSFTGKTGSGKTAFLMLLGLAIAFNRGDLFRNTIEPGRVAYLTAENPRNFRMRLIATCGELGIDVTDTEASNKFVVQDFFSKPEDMLASSKLHEADGGFRLVIIDTAASFFDGDNENDRAQIMKFLRGLRPINQMKENPTIVIATHPVKNAADDNLIPAGGGSFLNEVDGNLTLHKETSTRVGLHWQGKIRGTEFDPLAFEIREITCEAVKDKRGNLIKMPILECCDPVKVAESISQEGGLKIATLRKIEKQAGMTQIDLAKALNVRTGTMNKWIKYFKAQGWIKEMVPAVTRSCRRVSGSLTTVIMGRTTSRFEVKNGSLE